MLLVCLCIYIPTFTTQIDLIHTNSYTFIHSYRLVPFHGIQVDKGAGIMIINITKGRCSLSQTKEPNNYSYPCFTLLSLFHISFTFHQFSMELSIANGGLGHEKHLTISGAAGRQRG